MEVSLDVISGVAIIVPFIVCGLQTTTLPPPFMKLVTPGIKS
jgi:hypothetical protein